MDSDDPLLAALNAFAKDPSDKIPDLLNSHLESIALTGETIHPWESLKPLLIQKLDKVMKDFEKSSTLDCWARCPNVENVQFEAMRKRILFVLEEFTGTPFTIQRLCELVVNPRKHYKRTDKFMRGVEKNTMVVSTVDVKGNKIVSQVKPMTNGLESSSSFAESSSVLSASVASPLSNFHTNTPVNSPMNYNFSPSSSWHPNSPADSPLTWSRTSAACVNLENKEATTISSSCSEVNESSSLSPLMNKTYSSKSNSETTSSSSSLNQTNGKDSKTDPLTSNSNTAPDHLTESHTSPHPPLSELGLNIQSASQESPPFTVNDDLPSQSESEIQLPVNTVQKLIQSIIDDELLSSDDTDLDQSQKKHQESPTPEKSSLPLNNQEVESSNLVAGRSRPEKNHADDHLIAEPSPKRAKLDIAEPVNHLTQMTNDQFSSSLDVGDHRRNSDGFEVPIDSTNVQHETSDDYCNVGVASSNLDSDYITTTVPDSTKCVQLNDSSAGVSEPPTVTEASTLPTALEEVSTTSDETDMEIESTSDIDVKSSTISESVITRINTSSPESNVDINAPSDVPSENGSAHQDTSVINSKNEGFSSPDYTNGGDATEADSLIDVQSHSGEDKEQHSTAVDSQH